MNQSEKKDIALNMSVLMKTILYKESNQEEVANCAISFCREMLRKYPDIKDLVEKMTCDDWDTDIAWINWERQMLS